MSRTLLKLISHRLQARGLHDQHASPYSELRAFSRHWLTVFRPGMKVRVTT